MTQSSQRDANEISRQLAGRFDDDEEEEEDIEPAPRRSHAIATQHAVDGNEDHDSPTVYEPESEMYKLMCDLKANTEEMERLVKERADIITALQNCTALIK